MSVRAREPAGAALGTADWTLRTGGVLSREERRRLIRRLLPIHAANLTGRIRLALRLHPGRHRSVAADVIRIPDSALTREATEAAGDLLSPSLLYHSYRTYAWGAALAAVEGVVFDPEILYLASMLHDTGLMSGADGADFTVKSAQLASDFARSHDIDSGRRQRITDAICLHHTPGVGLDHGPEPYLTSAGAAVDVFGLRAWDLPDQLRRQVASTWPRAGFKTEFAGLFATEAKRVPHGRAWLLHRYAASSLTIRIAPFD